MKVSPLASCHNFSCQIVHRVLWSVWKRVGPLSLASRGHPSTTFFEFASLLSLSCIIVAAPIMHCEPPCHALEVVELQHRGTFETVAVSFVTMFSSAPCYATLTPSALFVCVD